MTGFGTGTGPVPVPGPETFSSLVFKFNFHSQNQTVVNIDSNHLVPKFNIFFFTDLCLFVTRGTASWKLKEQ